MYVHACSVGRLLCKARMDVASFNSSATSEMGLSTKSGPASPAPWPRGQCGLPAGTHVHPAGERRPSRRLIACYMTCPPTGNPQCSRGRNGFLGPLVTCFHSRRRHGHVLPALRFVPLASRSEARLPSPARCRDSGGRRGLPGITAGTWAS